MFYRDTVNRVVNKHDYHYQTTWLHEPAAGTMHHDKTRIMINDVIDTNKIKFVKDTVVEVKPEDRKSTRLNSSHRT